MVKVKVLSKCEHCDGKANFPFKEDVDYKGEKYMRYIQPELRWHRAGDRRNLAISCGLRSP